jgi:hypothetical protein
MSRCGCDYYIAYEKIQQIQQKILHPVVLQCCSVEGFKLLMSLFWNNLIRKVFDHVIFSVLLCVMRFW